MRGGKRGRDPDRKAEGETKVAERDSKRGRVSEREREERKRANREMQTERERKRERVRKQETHFIIPFERCRTFPSSNTETKTILISLQCCGNRL